MTRKHFQSDVESLCTMIDELGNAFEEEAWFHYQPKISPTCCNTVKQIKAVGLEQYQHVVRDRLVERSKSLNGKIPLNKLLLFSDRPSKHVSQNKVKQQSTKNDSKLFFNLSIGCQNRD